MKGYYILNYESLIPLMIKYIQDLNKRIDELESKITDNIRNEYK